MTEVDMSKWPELTEAQIDFIGFVASHVDTEIPPDGGYIVGTYELGDESIELLSKYIVFRLHMFDDELSAATIMHLAHDKTLVASASFEPTYSTDDHDTDPPFMVNVGERGDNTYYETDEQMQPQLRKLDMLEQSGVLRRIVTDPEDHIPAWKKQQDAT